MYGIVGAIAQRPVAAILLEGLRRLEYRGYDSAGLAVLDDSGRLDRRRELGKVARLAEAVAANPLPGTLGIAHTRWATHGEPATHNAHPHVSHDGCMLVHNGIIENYEELRREQLAAGYVFTSETDTEVVVHAIHAELAPGQPLVEAVRAATGRLRGAYALGVIDAADPERPVKTSTVSAESTERGPYRHYMQKEIFEQPRAIADTLEGRLTGERVLPEIFGNQATALFAELRAVTIVACGTSFHAALVARYWMEAVAGLPCQVEVASEYRYRQHVAPERALFVTISQSGETADTLAALRQAKASGYAATLAICNVPESSLVRESDLVFLTHAGPEIGVASTKAFTTQLVALLLLTIALGRFHRLDAAAEAELVALLRTLPGKIEAVLGLDETIAVLAERFIDKQHALFLGRGEQYPIAMEGALKLKEISYIHAEAYAAGELKHGPLALIDEQMPVVAVAPNNALLEKLKSNLEEVRARGGQLIVFADFQVPLEEGEGVTVVRLPETDDLIDPLIFTVPLQLLAYHVAVLKGTDVDQPRNLAKSVTVE